MAKTFLSKSFVGCIMENLYKFNIDQIQVINGSVSMAEDLVSDYYKMSNNQWLQAKYDVKTLVDLDLNEVVDGPFAQVIKYVGRKKDAVLSSSNFDYYKICIQDHSIISELERSPNLKLFPFVLYIIIHELIHIVRFSRFLHFFEASSKDKIKEEATVHGRTREILDACNVAGISDVLKFYDNWSPQGKIS